MKSRPYPFNNHDDSPQFLCVYAGPDMMANTPPMSAQGHEGDPDYCQHCGSKIERPGKFCYNCGFPVPEEPDVQA